jgi:hypothetical protein
MDLGRSLDRHFDEGLLGPEEQRQRVETVHGFAISMAGGWTAEHPPPDPDAAERLGLRALLTLHPRAEDAQCSVFVAVGNAPPRDDASRDDSDAAFGKRLLGPWLAARGVRAKGWGATIGGSWDELLYGLSFRADGDLYGAAWVIPHADDRYVLACIGTPGSDEEPDPWWFDEQKLLIGMGPVAESLEFLPPEGL